MLIRKFLNVRIYSKHLLKMRSAKKSKNNGILNLQIIQQNLKDSNTMLEIWLWVHQHLVLQINLILKKMLERLTERFKQKCLHSLLWKLGVYFMVIRILEMQIHLKVLWSNVLIKLVLIVLIQQCIQLKVIQWELTHG